MYKCFKMVLVPGLQYWKMNCMGSLFLILTSYSASLPDYHRFEYLVLTSLLHEEKSQYVASGVFQDETNGLNQLLLYYEVYLEQ